MIRTWREQLAYSAELWGRGERFERGPGYCVALSGSGCVDLNAVFCFGEDPEHLRRAAAEAPRDATPRVLMVAGPALGWPQLLVEEGWVCIGSIPAMRLAAGDVRRDPAEASVRRLGRRDLPAARALARAAYGGGDWPAHVALPDDVVGSGRFALWGLEDGGRLVCAVATASAEGAAVGWNLATPPCLQRRGYARRLVLEVCARLADAGEKEILLLASRAGERMYRNVGFEELEHWQQWSRPRWALGRS